MSDRVVVMHERRIKGVLARDELSQERIATLDDGQARPPRKEGGGMRRELGMGVALILMCLGLCAVEPGLPRALERHQHAAPDLDARHLRDRHRRS